MRLLVLALIVCMAGTLQAGAELQNVFGAAELTPAESLAVASEVKAELAERLGLQVHQLEDDVDLVMNLNLDQAVVYEAVQSVLDLFGVKQVKELTLVADIIHAAQRAKVAARAATSVSRRGSKISLPTSSWVQTVYYVTDRKPSGDSDPETFFSGQRSENGRLRFGYAEVNIPCSHKRGMLESPWLQLKSLREPSHHIFILKLDETSEDQFFNAVTSRGDGSNDVLVYVHGFNVSFDDAIRRAAQIAVDLGFKGTPIVFSWPSAAEMTAYNSDWENVNWSTKHIELFLEALANKGKDGKIYLIAHSMGSKGLLNALRMLAYRGKTGPIFDTVILCAPDFDAGLFSEQVAAEIRPLGREWVVYTSRKDLALSVSEEVKYRFASGHRSHMPKATRSSMPPRFRSHHGVFPKPTPIMRARRWCWMIW